MQTLAAHVLALLCAQTTPSTTVVLPVIVGELELSAAEVETAARSAAEGRLGVRLTASDDLSVDPARALRCGGDARCLADLYTGSATDSVLIVIVNAVASPVALSARMLDVASARFVAESYADVSAEAVAAHLPPLLASTFDAAGQRRWATLTLSLTPSDARVLMGAVATSGGTLHVPPGPLELTATAPGHRAQHLALSLAPGEARTLALALEPEPRWFESPLVWAGAAGVAVAAAATIVVLTRPERDTRLCLTPCP